MSRSAFQPLMLAVALSLACPAIHASEADSKAIRVRDTVGALKLEARAEKKEYKVDEPIRLKVEADRDFYLYVYTVDAASGNAWLLLPNKKQSDNHFKANQSVRVPDKAIEFVADTPGTEKLIVVGSLKKVDLDPLQLAQRGELAETKTQALEGVFESKGIRVRDHQANQAEGVVVKTLEIKVTAKSPDRRGEVAAPTVSAFIATPRNTYRESEKIDIVYGASEAGWTHLYVIEPDGKRNLLKRQKVKGDEQLKTTARAESPFGKHQLVVIWSKNESVDEAILDRVDDSKAFRKGLRLENDGQDLVFAVRPITIERD